MIKSIINFSIKFKLIVFLFTTSIAGFGIFSLSRIPVGAVPDITNNQVQVITTSTNLSTQDIEQFITYPVELEMANLPGVEEIRSVSKFGLSVVTIVFDESMGTYLPRQLIEEKIKTATENIPAGFGAPSSGPISTGLGEIYQYTLDLKKGYENKYTPAELRTMQDWLVKRYLSGIPGVVEINSWGGYLKQYEVSVNPEKLQKYGISLIEVYNALNDNNSIAGGAYIEKENQSYFIRGNGLLKSVKDIKSVVVKKNKTTPVLIKDIAEVKEGYANRFGAITANGEGEKVLGQIMMLKDANSKNVINAVHERIKELQKILPEGVYINPILDRSELLSRTTFTISENLILGSVIVILVVLLILGDIRSSLLIASIIPLSLLFTISLMYIFGIDANLMSLGALDFGIIIDGGVILVEYIVFKLTFNKEKIKETPKSERLHIFDKITSESANKMMSSAIFGQVIILIILIPILTLSGVEGKMFRPMALTFSFAIIGAMILGFTWLPAASALFLKPKKKAKKNISERFMNLVFKSYSPVLKWSYGHKKIVLGLALASLIFTGITFSNMGGEFVPTLDEGDFVIQPVLKTGTSLSKTIETTTKMEAILINNFPEVDKIVSRIGAAEVPTDPMSMEEIDMIVRLNPKSKWVNAKSKEELAEKFKEALSVLPGIDYEFTQPIEMRFNELITGVRSDIAVKIYGEDLEYLNNKAIEIKKLINDVPGAADVIIEKTAGLPQISVNYIPEKISKYGLNIKELNHNLTMAFGGETAGNIFEGEKRFDLVVRFDKNFRKDIENIKRLPIILPDGNQIPMSEIADIKYNYGPAKISRDNTHRRVVVSINVRNRDLQSVVKDIEEKINNNIKLKSGYYISYGGQFENLKNATRRLGLVVPIALLLIFIFLHFAFKSIKEALLIYTAVPLSAVGGVTFLWIRGMPFSVSAGIGFIALFGIAVLNGIVLIEHFKELKKQGITDIKEIVFRGTKDRLRAVLLTASAAAFGFLPMAISTSAGAEVQRPLATVVIGGLITSTLLTMIALPLLYAIFDDMKAFKNKFRFNKTATIVILLIGLPVLSGGQTKEITLENAIAEGLKNNKELKISELETEKAKLSIPASYNFEKTNIFYGTDQNNTAENGYPLNVFGIEQSFDFPSVYISKKKAGKINADIYKTKYEIAVNKFIKEVSKSYYTILWLQNKRKLILTADSLYADYSTAAEKKYKSGETGYLELINAKAKHESIKLQKKQILSEISSAYEMLYALIQTDSIFVFPDIKIIPLTPVIREEKSNLTYLLTEKNIRYQNALLKTEKNKLLPSINVSLFNGSNSFPNSANYFGYQVGLGIPLLFTGQKAQIKTSGLAVESAKFMQQSYEINLKAKQKELLKQISVYSEKLDYYNNTGKKLAAELIKYAEAAYKKGETDYIIYVSSIENALNIKSDYLDNLRIYNNTVLELNYLNL